jgi:Tol biopolymer transport system component
MQDGPVSIERISANFAGEESEGTASGHDISSTGRYVVFVSDARDLAGGQASEGPGVYVRDTHTDEIIRVDKAFDGGAVNGAALNAKISADGRYITYTTTSDNLVEPGRDANGLSDVYTYDRVTGETKLVSVTAEGKAASGRSWLGEVSESGRYIAIISEAEDLRNDSTSVDRNNLLGSNDVYSYDIQTGEMKLASPLSGWYWGDTPLKHSIEKITYINEDTGFIYYGALAKNTLNYENHLSNTASVASEEYHSKYIPGTIEHRVVVSNDKNYLSFNNGAGNYIVGGSNYPGNSVGEVARASNGKFVAFLTTIRPDGGTDPFYSLYIFDLDTGQRQLLLAGSPDIDIRNLRIADDGSVITFESEAALTGDDTNGTSDVYKITNPFGSYGTPMVEPSYQDGPARKSLLERATTR